MLELYFHTTAFFSSIIYASICISSLLVFASYKKAYRKEKPTWIIQSVMLLFLSMGFSFLFFTLASLVNLIESVGIRYKMVVSLLTITNIPLLLAIINFWEASLNEKH